jgi:hypothetical protein
MEEILLLDCPCQGESFQGIGVYTQNGLWYFSSTVAGVGVHAISATCPMSEPDFWVTVVPYPDIVILPQNPVICSGENVQLSASGVQPGGTWQWSPATGLSSTTAATVIASPAQTTTYTVTGTNAGLCSSQAQVTVTVNPVYTLTLSASDMEICPGESLLLTWGGAPAGTTYGLYNSNSSSWNSTTNTSMTVSPSSTVTYWIELVGTTCFIQDDVTITVNDAPGLTANAQPGVICQGQTAMLTAVTEPGNTVSWSPSATLSSSTGGQVLATPSATTTYTATATNANGCSSTMDVLVIVEELCCVADNPPPTYLITQNTPDWVGQTYTLSEDLIIQSGVGFVVDNCTLKFATGKGIILESGADLSVVNNSKLTLLDLCDPFWRGISSQRVSNYANTADKNVIIISASTIEFAQTAISLQTIDTSNPNTTTNWALLQCSDVLLSNNHRDLWIRGQNATVSFYPNVLGQMSNCQFLLTADFPVAYSPNTSRSQIQNLGKAIQFSSCEFRNDVPAFLQSVELLAMAYRNAPVDVHCYAPNNTGFGNSPSRISGFTRGISGSGVGSINLVGTDFANWRSCYFWMRGKHLIEENDFYCLPAALFNALQGNLFIQSALSPITQESLDIAIAPYGLYMDGPDGVFNVVDNHFETTIPGYGNLFSHGMVANNTGDNPNRVRRNVFTYMQRALKIQGDNRNVDYQDGLKYSCNFFDFNDSDIREVNSTIGNANTFGVPHQFSLLPGNIPGDPANNFTQSSSGCGHCGFDDLSNTMTSSMSNHRYYREDSSQEPSDLETSPAPKVVIVNSGENADECETSVQLISVPESGQNVLSVFEESTLMLNELIQDYRQLVDDGNTSVLVQTVQSINYSQALELYYELMQISPNLSDEVIIEALAKLELPNVLMAQILSSNPHAAKSGLIQQAVEERPIPFDEYQKTQISLGLQQFSSKESLEGLIAGISSRRKECIEILFEQIDASDEITNKLESKRNILSPSIYVEDAFREIDLLFEYGLFEESASLAADIGAFHKIPDQTAVDYSGWLALMSIYHERSLDMEGFELSEDHLGLLVSWINTTSAFVSSRSLNLLMESGSLNYTEPIVEEQEIRSEIDEVTSNEELELRLYPNPSNGIIQITWNRPVSLLEIMNSTGQTVFQKSMVDTQRQEVLDLSTFANGVYLVRIMDFTGRVMNTSNLVKQ